MFSVLIVEDEEIIRENIFKSFDWKAHDCHVCDLCDCGESALSSIEKYRPEIVITDINMPGINGIELIQRGRSICFFEAIIITGFSQFSYAKKAIELSVIDFILKPIDEELLGKAIGKAIISINAKHELELLKHKEDMSFSLDKFALYTDDIYLSKVFTAIRNRYKEPLNIDLISNEIGLSSGYLSRKIQKSTGFSFLEILQQYRIEKAQKLIKENPNFKIYEIAEMVGFSSYKRFSEVFKKITGNVAKISKQKDTHQEA